MSAKYETISTIESNGVTLALKQRLDPTSLHYCMTWRETRPNGTNRRFYFENEAIWSLDVKTALSLIEQAEKKGLLDTKFDDPFVRFGGGSPSFVVSQELAPSDHTRIFDEITLSVGEPDWGPDPFFVIGVEPGGLWRKVMLVNTKSNLVTFRSCTTDPTHAMIKDMGKGLNWILDNTMMDCCTQIMREFLRHLKAA